MGASAGLRRTFGYLGAITSAAAQGGFYGHHADSTGLHHLAVFLVVIGVLFLLINLLDRSLPSTLADRRRQPSQLSGRKHP